MSDSTRARTQDEQHRTETDGVEIHDWQGSTFDPSNRRLFSILPECDDDEAYCVRHERDMVAVETVFRFDGALFATADDWDIWTCTECARETGPAGKRFFRRCVAWAFNRFDDTDDDVLEGAFQYVGEASDVDQEGGE